MDPTSADPDGRTRANLWQSPVRCGLFANRNSSLVIFSAILLAIAAGFLSVPAPKPLVRKPAAPPPDFSVDSIPVQYGREANLATGKLLVADADLRDPNFAETVILLVSYNERGAMGVIVNRTLPVKLAEVLPKIPGLENRSDTIYHGGPVERGEILMLVRTKEKPEDSRQVFSDVYLSTSADLLRGLTAGGHKSTAFRIYSGYAGWGPAQLESEVAQGSWHIFPATAETVFARQPDDLWQQFMRRATIQLAQQFKPPLDPQHPAS